MFGISDVCHGKAGFRMFAALFGFSDVDISDVRPGKAGFRMFAAPLVFRMLTYRMFALVKLLFGCLKHFLVFLMFEISDVCPGKAGFLMFAALFGFSDV